MKYTALLTALAVKLKQKVIEREKKLVHSLGITCKTWLLPSDYYSKKVTQRFRFFIETYGDELTCGQIDVVTSVTLLWKNLPVTDRFLEYLTDGRMNLRDAFTKSLRSCIDLSWKYHEGLSHEQQQSSGGILRFIHGPNYVYLNFTSQVIDHMANFSPQVRFSDLWSSPSNPSPGMLREVSLSIYMRLLNWSTDLKKMKLTQYESQTPLKVKCGAYSGGWQIRRLSVFLEIHVDPRDSDFFEAGISPLNTNSRGRVLFGGFGYLSLDPKRLVRGSRKVLLLRLLLRGLSRTSLSTFVESYRLHHLHVGDVSMLTCFFADIIVKTPPDNQIMAHVSDIRNMKGSKKSLQSDLPPWFVILSEHIPVLDM